MPAILDVAALFDDVEITFGSERVLSRELAALEQVTTATGYRFTDALADQKAFIERFVRPVLSQRGARLLERVQDGSLRFRLLRETPSHAKLYLLTGDQRFRAIAGSANLSLAAFSGRQRETFFVADGEADYRRFLDYYAENEARSDPIDADLLVVTSGDDDAAGLDVPADPVPLQDVPCFRFLKAQGAIVETPRPPVVPDLSAAALREAGALGAELQQIALDRNRSGATVVSASGFMRAYRAHAARPITEKTDRVPEARIDLASGLVTLDGRPWHRIGAPVPWPEVQADAALLAPYFEGFGRFYGDASGLQRSYWALVCWLYAAPFAPALRTAALRHDGSPLAYPVHAVLYGRSDGGKTMFSRVISRSMFGLEQMVRGKDFTTQRALGLRERLGAIPLIVDDVNRDRFTQYVPDLVKFDHESGEGYAPILISTNRDVTAVTPDLRKRMVVCHIDGARPRGMPEAPARAALSGVGTALYRTYLDRLVPRLAELIRGSRPRPAPSAGPAAGILGDAQRPPRRGARHGAGLGAADRAGGNRAPQGQAAARPARRDHGPEQRAGTDQSRERRPGGRLRRRSQSGGALREAGPGTGAQRAVRRRGEARSRRSRARLRLRARAPSGARVRRLPRPPPRSVMQEVEQSCASAFVSLAFIDHFRGHLCAACSQPCPW